MNEILQALGDKLSAKFKVEYRHDSIVVVIVNTVPYPEAPQEHSTVVIYVQELQGTEDIGMHIQGSWLSTDNYGIPTSIVLSLNNPEVDLLAEFYDYSIKALWAWRANRTRRIALYTHQVEQAQRLINEFTPLASAAT